MDFDIDILPENGLITFFSTQDSGLVNVQLFSHRQHSEGLLPNGLGNVAIIGDSF